MKTIFYVIAGVIFFLGTVTVSIWLLNGYITYSLLGVVLLAAVYTLPFIWARDKLIGNDERPFYF